MTTTLDPALSDALDAFVACERVVVATDFDGVLAPLVEDPMASRPLPGTAEALKHLARMPGTTVAAVSGRDLDTLGRLSTLGGDEHVVLYGSHGAQSTLAEAGAAGLTEAQRTTLAALDAALVEITERHEGARIERKPAAVVLHTRGIDDAVAAAATAETVTMAGQHSCHVMPGKCVVELSVVEADKGSAIEGLARLRDAGAVYYVGDDVTDEKAFAAIEAAGRPHDVTVKVGDGETRARHRVATPEEAAGILAELVTRRAAR